jgi:hypothetical protein
MVENIGICITFQQQRTPFLPVLACLPDPANLIQYRHDGQQGIAFQPVVDVKIQLSEELFQQRPPDEFGGGGSGFRDLARKSSSTPPPTTASRTEAGSGTMVTLKLPRNS